MLVGCPCALERTSEFCGLFQTFTRSIRSTCSPWGPGAFYIMDRAYIDFARLHKFTNNFSFFVIRAKSNLHFSRVYSMPVDRQTGLICDQHIRLSGKNSCRSYPAMLRRVKSNHPETGKRLAFLTNNFTLQAANIQAYCFHCIGDRCHSAKARYPYVLT